MLVNTRQLEEEEATVKEKKSKKKSRTDISGNLKLSILVATCKK